MGSNNALNFAKLDGRKIFNCRIGKCRSRMKNIRNGRKPNGKYRKSHVGLSALLLVEKMDRSDLSEIFLPSFMQAPILFLCQSHGFRGSSIEWRD